MVGVLRGSDRVAVGDHTYEAIFLHTISEKPVATPQQSPLRIRFLGQLMPVLAQ